MDGKVIFLKVWLLLKRSRPCQLLHFSKVERNSNPSLEQMKLEFVKPLKNCWLHNNHKCSC